MHVRDLAWSALASRLFNERPGYEANRPSESKNYKHLQVLPAQKLDGGLHGEQLTVSEEQMQNGGYHPPVPVDAVCQSRTVWTTGTQHALHHSWFSMLEWRPQAVRFEPHPLHVCRQLMQLTLCRRGSKLGIAMLSVKDQRIPCSPDLIAMTHG